MTFIYRTLCLTEVCYNAAVNETCFLLQRYLQLSRVLMKFTGCSYVYYLLLFVGQLFCKSLIGILHFIKIVTNLLFAYNLKLMLLMLESFSSWLFSLAHLQ